jgi:hypothetical protein
MSASPNVFIYNQALFTEPEKMRLLVLSDIHANADALEAVFKTADGRWDRTVCLGDVVGYGPDPNEVIAQILFAAITIRRSLGS